MPRYYHRTVPADAFRREGFRDGEDVRISGRRYWPGVWISDIPLDSNEGADGPAVFGINLPAEPGEQFEVFEDGKPYRE
jgi:hypothetical protein